MKNKFDLNEIECDEQMWHLKRFYRDMWILGSIVVILLVLTITL